MLTPDQIELRRSGIGSSDIAAICGLDTHRAPIDVYLDKLGLAEHTETTATWCGDRLEESVALLYEERAGMTVTAFGPGRAGGSATLEHHHHRWALATPDRWRDDGAGIVEIKNVGGFMAHRWGDAPHGAPTDKVIQVQWQLEVCDVDRAHIAALIGGTDFRIYEVERDRDLAADLLELARLFWEEHVLARNPPPMSGEDARRLAQMRYPLSMGDMLPTTPEAEALRDRILRVKRHQKRVEDLRAQLEARAMEMVGNADGIKDCFSWKRAGKAETWKAAARESFMAGAMASAEEMWGKLEAWAGDDEAVWQALATRGVASAALVKTEGAPRRRFLTKEPKNGGDRR